MSESGDGSPPPYGQQPNSQQGDQPTQGQQPPGQQQPWESQQQYGQQQWQPPYPQQQQYGQQQYGQQQYGQPYGQSYPPAPPPYGQAPYGSYGYPQAAPGTNGLAIASLVIAFFCSPAGLICGIIALNQIKSQPQGGRGLAIAGIVLSSVFLVAGIALVTARS